MPVVVIPTVHRCSSCKWLVNTKTEPFKCLKAKMKIYDPDTPVLNCKGYNSEKE